MDHEKIKLSVGDLPPGEAIWMVRHRLSPCCHNYLILGPRGGGSVNVWCIDCHARFNIMFDWMVDWGQVIVLDDPEFPKRGAELELN